MTLGLGITSSTQRNSEIDKEKEKQSIILTALYKIMESGEYDLTTSMNAGNHK